MNNIFTRVRLFPTYMGSLIRDHFSKLTPLQQKVTLVAGVAIAALTAIVMAYRCFSSEDSRRSRYEDDDSKKHYSRSRKKEPLYDFFSGPSLKKSSVTPVKTMYSAPVNHSSSSSLTSTSSPNTQWTSYSFPVNYSSSSSSNTQGTNYSIPVNSSLMSSQYTQQKKVTGSTYTTSHSAVVTTIKTSTQAVTPVTENNNLGIKNIKLKNLDALDEIESNLDALIDNIEFERKLIGSTHPVDSEEDELKKAIVFSLSSSKSSATTQNQDVLFEETNSYKDTQKFEKLERELDKTLGTYSKDFHAYLAEQFKGRKDHHAIHEHIIMLAGFMYRLSHKKSFIQESLKEIDLFLTNHFFTDSTVACLDEKKKTDLIIFSEFFTIVDQHILVIKQSHPQLAQNLKIKLANLPLIEGQTHSKYVNIYLTLADQLTILVDHFQRLENTAVDTVINALKNQQLDDQAIKKLSSLATQTYLNKSNLLKLRNTFTKDMPITASLNGNDKEKIYRALKNAYSVSNNRYQVPSRDIVTSLYRASKAKRFFESQIGLPEDKIQIPRWYHSTKFENIEPIVDSGKILVLKKQLYEGAWVSNQREESMGNCTLVFNASLTDIKADVFIGFEHDKRENNKRWRGLQTPIPIKGSNPSSNLVCVSLNRTADKTNKLTVMTILNKQGLVHIPVFSNQQLDFMQEEIIKAIGNPNLPEKWWGKADITHLDRPPGNGRS